MFVGRGLKLETRQGRAVEPAPHRAEARPLHLKPPQLERWGAERGVWVGGRAGRDSRGWS
jgi:hypothetical protein